MSSAVIDNNGLPNGWKLVKFSDVVNLKHGHQFRTNDFVSEGIPVIKIGQCKIDGTLDLSKCDFVSKSRISEFEEYKINKGDILMALTGGTLGKVTEVKEDYGLVFQNYRVGNFIPLKGISYGFTRLILLSDIFQNLVKEKVNQGAQPNIGKENIDNMLIPLPPLQEQQRIVNKLDNLFERIDKAIALSEENLQHANNLLPAALNEVFEDAEEKSKSVELGKYVNIISGYAFNSQNFSSNNSCKCVKITNVGVNEFIEIVDELLPESFRETYKNFQVQEGDVVISLTRSIINNGLKICVVPKSYNNSLLNQRVAALKNSKNSDLNYVYYFLRTSSVFNYILEKSRTMNQPNLSIKDLSKILISIPDLPTQQKIVKQLNAISTQQQQLQQHYSKQLQQLKALKASLLNAAFSGSL